MCVHACVHLLPFSKKKKKNPKKNFSSETIDWTFTKFQRGVPEIEAKIFSSPLQKNQACGAIQALKRL